MKQVELFSIEINKTFPVQVQCLAGQPQVQTQTLVIAIDQMPDYTYCIE